MDDRAILELEAGTSVGSAYALGPRCVLTARHVLPTPGMSAKVRPLRGAGGEFPTRWWRVREAWRDPELDLALLLIEDGEDNLPDAVRPALTRLSSPERIAVEATGFPELTETLIALQPDGIRHVKRDTWPMEAVLNPRIRAKSPEHHVEVRNLRPPYGGLWRGMSGAAVMPAGKDLVIGVIKSVDRAFDGDLLKVVPVHDMPDRIACAPEGRADRTPGEIAEIDRAAATAALSALGEVQEIGAVAAPRNPFDPDLLPEELWRADFGAQEAELAALLTAGYGPDHGLAISLEICTDDDDELLSKRLENDILPRLLRRDHPVTPGALDLAGPGDEVAALERLRRTVCGGLGPTGAAEALADRLARAHRDLVGGAPALEAAVPESAEAATEAAPAQVWLSSCRTTALDGARLKRIEGWAGELAGLSGLALAHPFVWVFVLVDDGPPPRPSLIERLAGHGDRVALAHAALSGLGPMHGDLGKVNPVRWFLLGSDGPHLKGWVDDDALAAVVNWRPEQRQPFGNRLRARLQHGEHRLRRVRDEVFEIVEALKRADWKEAGDA